MGELSNTNQPKRVGKYVILNVLSDGAYGRVVRVRNEVTRKEYACKVILRSFLKNSSMLFTVEQELRVHSFLKHKNIVNLEEIIYTDEAIYAIIEYCSHGDLYDFMVSNKQHKSFVRLHKIICQLAEALCYLHAKNIYHRDIKPENILLDENDNVKLCDFGCICTISQQDASNVCGTIGYMAPEMFDGKSYDAEKADVWAFGKTIYELLAFENQRLMSLSGQSYARNRSDTSIDLQLIQFAEFKKIIHQCCNLKPENRPSMSQILESEALRKAPQGVIPSTRAIFSSMKENIPQKFPIHRDRKISHKCFY